MKNMIFVLSLIFGLNVFAMNSLTCGSTIQGGPDVFPWSTGKAQPFPWSKIQGLWVVEGQSDLIFKLKVIRQTARLKQLEVEIYSNSESCSEPQMKGVGIITALEKNVIRINANNKLIRLAVFNPLDLELNADLCREPILAATVIDLGFEYETPYNVAEANFQTSNMVLKKITPSLNLYCKKP